MQYDFTVTLCRLGGCLFLLALNHCVLKDQWSDIPFAFAIQSSALATCWLLEITLDAGQIKLASIPCSAGAYRFPPFQTSQTCLRTSGPLNHSEMRS